MIPLPQRVPLKLVIAVVAALLLALLIHDRNRWKAKTTHYAELLAGERAAHSATVANYRAAAEQARREDAENVARVKSEQATINERTANDFESRIAAARARAGELRRNTASAADPRLRRTAPVPSLPASAAGTPEGAGEDRFSEAEHRSQTEVAPLGADDALIATEQAIQLDELIRWVRRQAAVAPKGD